MCYVYLHKLTVVDTSSCNIALWDELMQLWFGTQRFLLVTTEQH